MTIEIIAEISGCHGGELTNAIELIRLARNSGATGVKFQCFDPERLVIRRAGHPRLRNLYKPDEDGGPTHQLRALYQQIHTPQEWFPDLVGEAHACGLTWHASVFDPADVEFLERIQCPRYKIASFEAADVDIRDAVGQTKKPCIMSVNQGEDVNVPPSWLVLHATNYAIGAKQANLARLRYWHDGRVMSRSHWRWGLSDHTTDNVAPLIATALGAIMIEWHIKLSTVHTPDDVFAWTASEFAHKVRRVREVAEAMDAV